MMLDRLPVTRVARRMPGHRQTITIPRANRRTRPTAPAPSTAKEVPAMPQLSPPEARLKMLQACGVTADEARLIDEHALAEARRAFEYGMKVVRTLTPSNVHGIAESAYCGAMRFMVEEWRQRLIDSIGETRQ